MSVEEYLRTEGPVVELGVGNGRIAIEAARRGKHIINKQFATRDAILRSSSVPAKPSLSIKLRTLSSSSLMWCFACVVAVTAILYWRRPDAFYNPQFWAEDGSRFFTGAFFIGARSLVIPLAGFFHTLARLVAWIGSWIPVRYAPHWYGAASWALLVSMISYIFSARFSLSNRQKLLLGLALVATTADNEVFFNLANWATITSLFWLLLAASNEPQSQRQALFDIAVLILAGLNSPFVICLWPTFLLRWWVRRTAHNGRLLALSLAVAVIQVWNMPTRITAGGIFPQLSSSFVDVLICRFGFMFLGEQVYRLELTDPLRICGLATISGFYGGLFWHAVRQKNWSLVTILGGGILAELLSLYVMRNSLIPMMHSAGRHFFIPAVTVTWALLLSNLRPRHLSWSPLTLILIAFLFLTPSSKNQILPDLDWAGHVAQWRGTQLLCKIPINPVWDPPAWFAYMNSRTFNED